MGRYGQGQADWSAAESHDAGIEITKDTKELSFPLTVDATAPAGQHKNLYCQVVVTQNGEPIVQNVGSTELRIDKPLVAAVAAQPKAASKPAVPTEKRLSRLEQLRKEQEEREKCRRRIDRGERKRNAEKAKRCNQEGNSIWVAFSSFVFSLCHPRSLR